MQSANVRDLHINMSFQKIFMSTTREFVGNSKGFRGPQKAIIFKGKYEPKLELP